MMGAWQNDKGICLKGLLLGRLVLCEATVLQLWSPAQKARPESNHEKP